MGHGVDMNPITLVIHGVVALLCVVASFLLSPILGLLCWFLAVGIVGYIAGREVSFREWRRHGRLSFGWTGRAGQQTAATVWGMLNHTLSLIVMGIVLILVAATLGDRTALPLGTLFLLLGFGVIGYAIGLMVSFWLWKRHGAMP